MKDFRGRDIQQGDTVVVARRRSSTMWLTEGQVREAYDDKIVVWLVEKRWDGVSMDTATTFRTPSYVAVLGR